MPPKNDFSKQHAEFTKNLGVLNKTITDANSDLKSNISDQTKLIKKSGALNVKAMKDHATEVHNASKRIKSGIIQKEIELKSDKLEKTINNLSEATYKLDESSENFKLSAKDLSMSNKELSSSMGDVVDVTNKHMESLKYVGDNMKKLAKWAVIGGLAGAGYMGYKAVRGAGRAGARVATAPIRAGVGAIKAYGDIQEGAATDILGNVRTDLWGSYKKALGTGLALAGGGLAPGMFFESGTANLLGGAGGEGGSYGGPGMMSRMAGGAGELARRGYGGLQFGVNKLTEFVTGFPKETSQMGIFKMAPAYGDSLQVSPDEEFKEIISEPDVKIQSKIMTKSLTAALDESGKSGLLKRMFTGVFKLGTTIAYALPIFGAGYKAELPEVRKYGMFGAMLQTLGMLYVHSRFASEESNRLALQQARLLQIGFEIPGSLWRPGPRSLSEWIGKTIGDTLSGETGPLTFMKEMLTGKIKGLFGGLIGTGKEKGLGLLNMIPGYKEWALTKGKQRESAELKASPSLATRILLLTNMRDILIEMRDIMTKRGGSAMAKPLSLAKAATNPHVVTRTGVAELHAGETVGGSRGGIFSRIFGGIAGIFSGGIFKKIKDWISGLFTPITAKLDQLLNWFKATFSFLSPAVEAMHEIQTAFGVGKGSKITELSGGGGLLVQKRQKKSIFGGIFNSIRELPFIVERSLTKISENLKEIFNQTLGSRNGIGSIIIKAYQTLVPDIFKKAGEQIFMESKNIITAALTSAYDLAKESSKVLVILDEYGSKIVRPFQEAWGKGESPFTNIVRLIGAIPKSTWEAIKGLIPLGRDLFSAVGNILDASTIMQNFSRTLQQAMIVDIPNIISTMKKEFLEKILPESWSMLFNKISDRMLEWSQVSFKSFYSAFDAMDEAAKSFTEERIRKPGIAGIVTGIFQYMFKILKAAFDPLGEALVNSWNDLVWLGKGVRNFSFSKLLSDFGEMWKKMKTLSILIQDQIKMFTSFVKGPKRAMAKGGLLYAAKGVVVGEAGPEAILPLNDPVATKRISGMLSEALVNLGIGKGGNIGEQILNRLDVIISILGGRPGNITKKAGLIRGTIGIFGKLLNGITDIGIILTKLPFQIGSDIARGIATGLSKSIEVLTDVGHTILSAMRAGFTALRHTINIGVTTIKMAVKTAWATITAPFKAIGRFIMRPFEAIRDRYLKFKEGVKEKVKGVIQWLKPGGKTAPIAVDNEGKYVYAKWPALLVKYTKGIYQILLKEFGLGLPGFDIGNKIGMMKNLIPQLLPMITPYIIGAIGVAGIATALWDAFRGSKKAEEWHGVEKGKKASISQRITSGIGGFLGGTGEGLLGRIVWGMGKGAAIGAGAAAVPTLGVGAPIGAAIGALAGGILGALGGKNIAKGLQAIWDPIKKLASAIWKIITWPFDMILKIAKKFKGWIGEKIGSLFGRSGNKGGIEEIPEMARGGFINRPTMAFLGETGPEAVIPLEKAPAFARMINDVIMTSPRAIAEHEAILESSRQKIGADRLLEGNRRLQEALAARHPINNNVVTNQITNSNSLTNAINTNGVQQKLDEETERILGGRLS